MTGGTTKDVWVCQKEFIVFDTTILETSNSFSYLNVTSNTEASDLSFSNPIATSSPTKFSPGRTDLLLKVLVINYQSIKSPGKPAQLQNTIQSTRADIYLYLSLDTARRPLGHSRLDIIISTESWLSLT